jgi:hypothetical protein
MITEKEEYKKMVTHRLEENIKSFHLLFGMKHYGNCISIMCQELDQMIRILFLINSSSNEKQQFMYSSINSHKWYITNKENKKVYITDEMLLKFAETLKDWDKSIYQFGFSFKNLTNNFNYGSRDPIKSMSKMDRDKLFCYITEYHQKEFKSDFTIEDFIPILPEIIEKISIYMKIYLDKI